MYGKLNIPLDSDTLLSFVPFKMVIFFLSGLLVENVSSSTQSSMLIFSLLEMLRTSLYNPPFTRTWLLFDNAFSIVLKGATDEPLFSSFPFSPSTNDIASFTVCAKINSTLRLRYRGYIVYLGSNTKTIR